jgi:tetratricopeptide (TPR) repeat protein
MHYERREFAEAESYWRKAIAVWAKSSDSNRTHLIALLNNMGTLYSRTGRFEKALDMFARILSLEAAITDEEALALIKSNMNVGAIYCRLKRFEESEKHYDKALQQALNAFNLDHPIAVTVAAQYAKALRTMHRKDKAKQMAKLERLLREVCPASATAQTIDLNEMMRSIR